MTNPTTRRALIAGGATLGAVALPAAALATVATTDDARFLAWERKVDRLWAKASERNDHDVPEDVLEDLDRVDTLILTTKAPGATAARIKATVLVRWLEGSDDQRSAMREIEAALRAAGAA